MVMLGLIRSVRVRKRSASASASAAVCVLSASGSSLLSVVPPQAVRNRLAANSVMASLTNFGDIFMSIEFP